LLESHTIALSLLVCPASAMKLLAPPTVRLPLAATAVIAPLAYSRSAVPRTSILLVSVDGARPRSRQASPARRDCPR